MMNIRKTLKGSKGFTLIELVMVIVILAVLAAVAIPTFVNLSSEANSAAEQGVVGGVRAGITTYYVDPAKGNRAAYPGTLDGATTATACSTSNACFGTVLSQGAITSDWTKATDTTYTGPAGTTYTYTSATGDFS